MLLAVRYVKINIQTINIHFIGNSPVLFLTVHL